ncbi:MAG: peptidoglycan DD-metalloendopeptidase family protein [Magnetococcales bacterium]|nr:peptidoglycan DD-metalloendopeptidase family protein [Magnetococcales bacterium]
MSVSSRSGWGRMVRFRLSGSIPALAGLLLWACLAPPVMAGGKPAAPPVVSREELDKNRAALTQVVQRLKAEQEALRQAKQQERTLLDDLEQLDLTLEKGRQELEKLTASMEETRQEIPWLEERIKERKERLERQRRLMAGQMRMIYGLGEQGMIKMILSQDDAALAQRSVRYFGYLLEARHTRYQAFRESIQALNLAISEHQVALNRLDSQATEQSKLQANRQERRKERQTLLERVRADGESRARQVEALQQRQEEMTLFVKRLEEALAEALLANARYGHIAEQKGKLPPPIHAQGEERPPGIFYKAKESATVRSIFRGHVVYADWFKGYGLLVILDHGDHLFTLYGHNSRLVANHGDWVEKGDIIAESGDTGSLTGPGLYFEIRHQGEATDPTAWLAKKGA